MRHLDVLRLTLMADDAAPVVEEKRIIAWSHVIDAEAVKTGATVDPFTGAQAELRDSKTGRFVKGHKALAGGGRPKKGESLLEYTEKLVTKAQNMQAVAEAKLDRLLDRGAVGNRAWAEYRDTFHGKPADTLLVKRGDDPLTELMQELAARRTPIYIEGESRTLDGRESDDET